MRPRLPSALALCAAVFLTSCLGIGGEPPVIHRHSIGLFEMDESMPDPVFPSMAVRAFESRQRYEARVLAVDEADGSLHYLEDERWLEDPRDALTDVVREGLARSGAFAVIAPATSSFNGQYILDGTVLECDVVRPAAGPWRARLVLRLDAARVSSSEMLHAAVYTAERDLPGASARGIGRAISACAKEITETALRDWIASLEVPESDAPRDPR